MRQCILEVNLEGLGWSVMYSDCLGDQCTGLRAQTLASKKHFSFFFFQSISTKNTLSSDQ